MHDKLSPADATLAPGALGRFLSAIPALGTRSGLSASVSGRSIFALYPRGCDFEVLGALRYLMEVEGETAARLEAQASLEAGAVDAILTGRYRPSDDDVRRLCLGLGISRWLFFLMGSIKYGADLGFPELQWLIDERRRARAENADRSLGELVAEATRLLFMLGARRA